MKIQLHKIKQIPQKQNIAFVLNSSKEISQLKLGKSESEYILKKYPAKDIELIKINRFGFWLFFCLIPENYKKEVHYKNEALRKTGNKICSFIKAEKESNLTVCAYELGKTQLMSFLEGLLLTTYSFDKYKKQKDSSSLKKINILHSAITKKDLSELKNLIDSVFLCRDMVNEPGAVLTASVFSSIVKNESKKHNIKVEVFGKARMRSLKMNGLLAVNQGSTNSPTFTVIEWKPDSPVNDKPYVLVGKGVMFDSGGMSLKPPSAMEAMKSDMAGAAAVFSCIKAIASNKLNVHIIGLLPATDNFPGQNALAPGDLIKMANGKTVEVLNTDAEGRLIMADALCYAAKYKPKLVIDIATLTGSVYAAIGKYGIAGMHKNSKKQMELLAKSGDNVYERIVEFPLWEEYDKEMESDVADIRNIGKGNSAGLITAGSFLKNFVSYPWIHIDIASMGYMDSTEHYFGKGGSAVGVRLLYDFFKNKTV